MEKQWRYYEGDQECPICGSPVLVLSEYNLFQDGDPVKCPECGKKGWVSVDEMGVWIDWERDLTEDKL